MSVSRAEGPLCRGLNGAKPDPPRFLSLVLTEECNLSCAYCYLSSRGGGRMSEAGVRSAIAELLRAPGPEATLLFTGGEPLLELPLLRDAIRYARRACPGGTRLRIVVNSNGTLLTPAIVSLFAEQRVELQLSFDGVAEAQVRRDRASFELLDRLLAEMRASEPHFFRSRLSVALAVGPETVAFLADSIRYFLGRRVRDIRIGPVMQRKRLPPGDGEEELFRRFREAAEDSLRHRQRTGETPVALFRRRAEGCGDGRGDLLCAAGAGRSLALDGRGGRAVCPFLLSAGLEPGPDLFRRAGKYSAFGACSRCEFTPDCCACPGSILFEEDNGDPDRVPDFQCAFYRAAAAARARFLAAVPPARGSGLSEVRGLIRLSGLA